MAGLKVGAGKAEIKYTEKCFPNFRENYTHVHDDSLVQAIVFEGGIRFGFVAVGAVIYNASKEFTAEVAGLMDVPAENIVIHTKHVLSAPHCNWETAEHMKEKAGHMHKEITDEEAGLYAERDCLMVGIIEDAIRAAAKAARENLQPAKWGFALGTTGFIVNRVVETEKGLQQGINAAGPVDRTMPVFRFDDMNGKPIAIIFNVNAAPGVMENSFYADGRRAASGDLASATEKILDSEYEGAVSMYVTGSTGNHWLALRGLLDTTDKNGHQKVRDLGEEGFILVDILSTRLAEDVVRAVESIETKEFEGKLAFKDFVFEYPGQKQFGPGAPKVDDGKPVPPSKAGLSILAMDDTAIAFTGVEMGSFTYGNIKNGSAFKNTVLVEFAHPHGGGYLVEAEMYERGSYQANKSRFAKGGAELYEQDIIRSLNSMK